MNRNEIENSIHYNQSQISIQNSENINLLILDESHLIQPQTRAQQMNHNQIPRFNDRNLEQLSVCSIKSQNTHPEIIKFEEVLALAQDENNIIFKKYHECIKRCIIIQIIMSVYIILQIIFGLLAIIYSQLSLDFQMKFIILKLLIDFKILNTNLTGIKILTELQKNDSNQRVQFLKIVFNESYQLIESEVDLQILILLMKKRINMRRMIKYFFEINDDYFNSLLRQTLIIQLIDYIIFATYTIIVTNLTQEQRIQIINTQLYLVMMISTQSLPPILLTSSVVSGMIFGLFLFFISLVLLLTYLLLLIPFFLFSLAYKRFKKWMDNREQNVFYDKIKNIPYIEVNPKILSCCAICLMEYQNQELVTVVPCEIQTTNGRLSHYFHQECINYWLKQNGSCPICRKKFFNNL